MKAGWSSVEADRLVQLKDLLLLAVGVKEDKKIHRIHINSDCLKQTNFSMVAVGLKETMIELARQYKVTFNLLRVSYSRR